MTGGNPLDKRSQFIAARKREVFAALGTDLNLSAYAEQAERLFQMLTATIHYDYLADLEALHDAYHALDPASGADADAREAAYTTLTAGFERVLRGANFVEIDQGRMEQASTETGRVRMPVRTGTEDFRAIRLFSRGHHTEAHERSKWWGLRKEQVTLDIYDEVILLAALKPEIPPPTRRGKRRKATARPGSVMIKLFHDIAAADLDVVLPGVKVMMSTGDKLMLTVPALIAGIPLAIKIAPAFLVLYGLLRFYVGGGPEDPNAIGEALIVASGVVALGGFLMNQWIKYERRALRYQVEVNDTIYFHNVTNNVGIFDHIIGVAEEQDCKEALLAYFFLLTADGPITEPELDQKIEAWLERRFALVLDFEVDDALNKLERFGLLEREGPKLSVLPLPAALRELDRRWDGVFQFADVA